MWEETLQASLERIGYNITEAQSTAIEAWCHSTDEAVIHQVVVLVQKDFPRDSMTERMVEGPILSFLQKVAPDLVSNLDQTVASELAKLDSLLDDQAAKAGGA